MACPICSKPAQKPYLPFCSRRCADVDLSRWLKGSYAIPGREGEDAEDSPEGANSGKTNAVDLGQKGMDRE